jgi:hypothetical protein
MLAPADRLATDSEAALDLMASIPTTASQSVPGDNLQHALGGNSVSVSHAPSAPIGQGHITVLAHESSADTPVQVQVPSPTESAPIATPARIAPHTRLQSGISKPKV